MQIFHIDSQLIKDLGKRLTLRIFLYLLLTIQLKEMINTEK